MTAQHLLHSALALALVGGAIINGLASRTTCNRYRRWGFSPRFRFVVAASQLIASGLVATPPTQRLGSALALAIMAGVIGAAIRSREASPTIVPGLVAVIATLSIVNPSS